MFAYSITTEVEKAYMYIYIYIYVYIYKSGNKHLGLALACIRPMIIVHIISHHSKIIINLL